MATGEFEAWHLAHYSDYWCYLAVSCVPRGACGICLTICAYQLRWQRLCQCCAPGPEVQGGREARKLRCMIQYYTYLQRERECHTYMYLHLTYIYIYIYICLYIRGPFAHICYYWCFGHNACCIMGTWREIADPAQNHKKRKAKRIAKRIAKEFQNIQNAKCCSEAEVLTLSFCLSG